MPASLFEARRNAPDAWGAYNISAGWVSDVDLYRHRQNILLGALAGAHMKQRPENKGMKGTRTGLEILTSSTLNNKWLQTAISDNWSEAANKNSAQSLSNSNLDVPIFLSGLDAVDYCQDPRLAAGALQLVQEEGDLILIPPRFWHQVYHLEPSIALASQYVNELGKDTTFRHILKWCSTGDSEENVGSSATATSLEEISSLPVQDQVMSIIKKGLKLQHGIVKGPALMRKLLSKTENDD